MKLSEYCVLVKPVINMNINEIKNEYSTIGYDHKEYYDVVEFLDDSVCSIVEYVLSGSIEKDVDFAEAFRLAGIVDGYLTNTGITGKMMRDRNPLGGLFK